MQLVVNGSDHDHKGAGTVAALLAEVGAKATESAVMVNDRIIRRAHFETTRLTAGDRVEVLAMMGGG